MTDVLCLKRILEMSIKSYWCPLQVSFGVCFSFLFAWLPYACFSLYSIFEDVSGVPLWLTPIPAILAKSSVAYNPIIYVLLTRRYRYRTTKYSRIMNATIYVSLTVKIFAISRQIVAIIQLNFKNSMLHICCSLYNNIKRTA